MNGAAAIAHEDTSLRRLQAHHGAASLLGPLSGTNTITAASDSALVIGITAYPRPMKFSVKPKFNNTGAVTIKIDRLGPKDIKD
jgi:hypothetical protein